MSSDKRLITVRIIFSASTTSVITCKSFNVSLFYITNKIMSDRETLPSWLDLNVINKIVGKKLGADSYDVIGSARCDVDEKAGDHYLSEIIHFLVKVKTSRGEKTYRFVIKDMAKRMSDFIIYVKGVEKEVSMYNSILPNINEMLEEKITPEMFYESENRCIVLDDLSSKGFRIADRLALLDYEQSRMALITLGKFHAAGVKYYQISPKKFDVVGKETLYSGRKCCIPYYFGYTNIKAFLEILRSIEGGLPFIDLVEKLSETFWEDLIKAIDTEYGFKVLNHGDFWTTNILYRYDNNNKVADCKLIDFQLTRFSSPTLDLYQFITISMKPSVINDHLDDLLDIYIETLNSNLKRLDFPVKLSRDHLNYLMEKTIVFGLFSCLTLTEIALCDPDDPLDLSDITASDFELGFPRGNPYRKAYLQQNVQNHIMTILRFFKKKHYI